MVDAAIKRWYAESTNPDRLGGTPAVGSRRQDLMIGLSGAKVSPPRRWRG